MWGSTDQDQDQCKNVTVCNSAKNLQNLRILNHNQMDIFIIACFFKQSSEESSLMEKIQIQIQDKHPG